jgi:hypothetical protein
LVVVLIGGVKIWELSSRANNNNKNTQNPPLTTPKASSSTNIPDVGEVPNRTIKRYNSYTDEQLDDLLNSPRTRERDSKIILYILNERGSGRMQRWTIEDDVEEWLGDYGRN